MNTLNNGLINKAIVRIHREILLQNVQDSISENKSNFLEVAKSILEDRESERDFVLNFMRRRDYYNQDSIDSGFVNHFSTEDQDEENQEEDQDEFSEEDQFDCDLFDRIVKNGVTAISDDELPKIFASANVFCMVSEAIGIYRNDPVEDSFDFNPTLPIDKNPSTPLQKWVANDDEEELRAFGRAVESQKIPYFEYRLRAIISELNLGCPTQIAQVLLDVPSNDSEGSTKRTGFIHLNPTEGNQFLNPAHANLSLEYEGESSQVFSLSYISTNEMLNNFHGQISYLANCGYWYGINSQIVYEIDPHKQRWILRAASQSSELRALQTTKYTQIMELTKKFRKDNNWNEFLQGISQMDLHSDPNLLHEIQFYLSLLINSPKLETKKKSFLVDRKQMLAQKGWTDPAILLFFQ